jgi:hypothetical protein
MDEQDRELNRFRAGLSAEQDEAYCCCGQHEYADELRCGQGPAEDESPLISTKELDDETGHRVEGDVSPKNLTIELLSL